MTDTERLDFLDRQSFTRWVGYDHPDKCTTFWPVFAGQSLREQIDIAIMAARGLSGAALGSGSITTTGAAREGR